MSLKPVIIRDVGADPKSLSKAIGPKLGRRLSSNREVTQYAFVLKFPDGVVTGRSVRRSLEKIPSPRGSTLMVGTDFTVEARQLAEAAGCDLLSEREFGWTDALYNVRRLPR